MKICATYQVGLKVLLKKGNEFLFLIERDGKSLDLPGGRIDDTEHTVTLSAIMQREVCEELGSEVRYTLGKPLFQFRRHIKAKGLHVFLTVYAAEFLSGEIVISDEHTGYQWIQARDVEWNEESFVSREEFQAFKEYFES
ncbi:MAG: NUDIX hydrolase [bacterium]